MAEKHFLNVEYKDLKDPGSKQYGYNTVLGLRKQVMVKLSKGSGPKPALVLTAEADDCDDTAYLRAPVVHDLGESDKGDANFFQVQLPDVAGVTWRLFLKVGAGAKKEIAAFTTWRRLYLSTSFPDAKARSLYDKAFKMVEKSFKEAYIEVAENGVDEGDKEVKEAKNYPRTSLSVAFDYPKWEHYQQRFTLNVTAQGVTGHRLWTRTGDLLKLPLDTTAFRLRAPSAMDGVGPMTAIKVGDNGQTYLDLPKQENFFPDDELDHYRKITWPTKQGAKATTPQEVEESDELVVDLSAAPLAAAKLALDQGGTLKLELRYEMEQLGRSAGGSTQGVYHFNLTISDTTTPKKLAGVITHEIGHIFGVVKAAETTANGVAVRNPNYHTNDFGGQGNHCRHNARQVANGGTTSGYIYDYDATQGPLCTMHFKVDPNVDDAKFCLNCQGQLRRADMSSK